MKMLLKNLKKQTKHLVIIFSIIISSFIFCNNVKADTTCSSSDYCFSYDNETINHIMSDEIILNNIEELKQMFLNQSTYENYVIFFNGNTWHHSSNDYFLNILMYNGELEISHNSKTNDVLNFYGTDLQVYYYPYKKLFDEYNKSYGDMSLAKNYTDYYELIYTNTIVMGKDFNDNNRIYGFLIDSNKDILYKIKYSSYNKSYYFLDEERYINDGDVFPVYSQLNSNNTPIINFSSVDNITTIDEVEYITSKDLTINVKANNYENYVYLYKYADSDNWVTYNPINEESLINLNITENNTIIVQVIDKNTSEVVTTETYTITGINPYTGLTLRKTFNSGTNGNDLYSLNIYNPNPKYDIEFKIQFGPNDFDGSHTPYITQINSYAYNNNTQQKLSTSNVYIDNFTCYKEVEDDVETWCTGTLKTDINTASYYEIVFANTDNYYLYYYDNYTKNDRTIDITTNLFKDYNKYYFNMNSDKVYINLKNINQTNKKGSVIIPYYFLNNDYLDVKLRKYNSSTNSFESIYNSYNFSDTYYHKIDFEITDNYFPILTNKKDRYCTTYYTNGDDYYNFISTYSNSSFLMQIANIPYIAIQNGTQVDYLFEEETTCYQEEQVYFYVHKDFKVTFGDINSSEDIYIYDDNFNLIDKVDKDFNNTNPYQDENNNFFDSVKESFNYFITPIQEILNMISYIWSGLNPIIQYFIIFIFIFLIGLFVFKFLL